MTRPAAQIEVRPAPPEATAVSVRSDTRSDTPGSWYATTSNAAPRASTATIRRGDRLGSTRKGITAIATHAPRDPETSTPRSVTSAIAPPATRCLPLTTSLNPNAKAGSRIAANWPGFWPWRAAARTSAPRPVR